MWDLHSLLNKKSISKLPIWKVVSEYVRLCGYKHGGDRQAQCQSGTLISLDEIAKEINMSKRELQRALRVEHNLTDSMKELLDIGVITKIFAS